MKKYKLLKDLPGIPAGTEFREMDYACGHLHLKAMQMPEWTTSVSGPSYLYIYPSTKEIKEWFSEIPDYSFVRDGDAYQHPEYANDFIVIKGNLGNWANRRTLEQYKKKLGTEVRWFDFKLRPETMKPENLIYRPGKNPWDTPLVDKLGWGPLEPRPQRFEIRHVYPGWEVRGETQKTISEYPVRGEFKTREDAELFMQALKEGKRELEGSK